MSDDCRLRVNPRIEARVLSARWVGWHGESVTGKEVAREAPRFIGGRRGH